MRLAMLTLGLLTGFPLHDSLQAQGAARLLPDGSAIGLTVDALVLDHERFATVTLHLTRLQHNGLSPELSVGVMPIYLLMGAGVMNLDAGGAINVSFPDGTLLLRGGGGGLIVLGGGEGGALPSLHLGASLLFRIAKESAIRFDIVGRTFGPFSRQAIQGVSFGVGFSGLPKL